MDSSTTVLPTASSTIPSPTKKRKIEECKGEVDSKKCGITEKEFQSTVWKADGLMSLKFPDSKSMVLHRQGKQMPGEVKLGYFCIRALGFLPQLILEESGMNYELHVFDTGSFGKLKPSLPFGRLPALLDWNGKGNHLVQSGAIIRALATKTGLAGADSQQKNRCDMLFEQLKEAFNKSHFSTDAIKEGLKAGNDLSKVPRWEEMPRVNEYTLFQRSIATLRCFEALLQNSASDFLVGAQLTYVDLALWSKVFELSQPDNVPQWASKLDLPNITKLYSIIMERPNIIAFLQSGRLLPRFDKEYKFKAGIFCKPLE